jgi:EAL domain-containing protein (putative c-di-GMP-specific phosphodiesterase class I)
MTPADLNQLIETLFRRHPFPAWICEADSLEIVAANDAAQTALEYTDEEFRTMTLLEILPTAAAEWLMQGSEAVTEASAEGPADIVISPSFERDGHRVRSVFLTATNGEHATLDRLERMAYVDQPSGLPNRAALERHFAETKPGEIVAIALLRLDWVGLGLFSTTIASVDRVRSSASDRICDRAVEGLDIYAYDDRTFAFVFGSLETARGARTFIRSLQRDFDQPLEAGDARISSRLWTSLAVRLNDVALPAEIFADAQIALEAACDRDEPFLEFSPALRTAIERHVHVDRELRGAIDSGQLSVVYQPTIAFETGRIIAIEALVRWHSLAFGRVSTAELIANAEASGYIERIGEWVLDRAFADFSALAFDDHTRPRLCINISGRELRRRNLFGVIDGTAAKYGLRWDDLEIEVSETALMEDVRKTGTLHLRGMRERGARISLDDFGTGYSSLKNISTLPLDSVKIDQTFVRSLPDDPIKRILVGSLIEVSRKLGITVVAEGAESNAEITAIRELGCDAVQGYAISRPMNAAELTRFLRSYDIQRGATLA